MPNVGGTKIYLNRADMGPLLSVLINALYSSNKDIFLRELISNSADALYKICMKSFFDPHQLISGSKMYIKLIPNKDNGTLTIIDTGIGMTKPDLVHHLGTIAECGATSFIDSILPGTQVDLIGQFGIGFYSVFLIADKVTVITKSNDDDSFIWEYTGGDSYTIRRNVTKSIKRGTKIIIQLKKDELQYLEPEKLKEIVRKYCQFTIYPIYLSVDKVGVKEIIINQVKNEEEKSNDSEVEKTTETDVENVDDEGKIIPQVNKAMIKIKYIEIEEINNLKPIWTRNPKSVKREEYSEFYKAFANDPNDFLVLKHYFVEAQVEFRALLFIPRKASVDFYQNIPNRNNIKIYVRQVFLMDDCQGLVPLYLNFIKGIIDFESLPVNITRDNLQHHLLFKIALKNFVEKCIKLLQKLNYKEVHFMPFYLEFQDNIKLAIVEDPKNRKRLSDFLRFKSSAITHKLESVCDYVSRMIDNQDLIYYLLCESFEQGNNSIFIERFKKCGIEVFYLTDSLDEYVIRNLQHYYGYKFESISGEYVRFPNEEKHFDKLALDKDKYKDLCDLMKSLLIDKIDNVTVTNRLVNSPCCIVSSETAWRGNFKKLMRSLDLIELTTSCNCVLHSKVLEINPDDPIIECLYEKYATDKNDKSINDIIILLYDTACIASGLYVDDPNDYAKSIYQLIKLDSHVEENQNDDSSDDSDCLTIAIDEHQFTYSIQIE